MPPRRQQVHVRLTGERGERMAAAVALYADRIMVGDIVEVCGMSVSAVVRAVVRAGVPLRHRDRNARSRALAGIIADARLTDAAFGAWRDEVELSDASARIIWHLAGREQQDEAGAPPAIEALPQLRRRCQACGAVNVNPERCDACQSPR